MTDERRVLGPVLEEDAGTLERLPTFLTVDELAVLLRVNRNTVYEAIKRNQVPGVTKWGRCVRICRATVVEWMRGKGLGAQNRRSR